MPKAVIDGWVEIGEEVKSTIPKECPRCGNKLSKTDISWYNGIIFIFCMKLKCRYAEEYEA